MVERITLLVSEAPHTEMHSFNRLQKCFLVQLAAEISILKLVRKVKRKHQNQQTEFRQIIKRK